MSSTDPIARTPEPPYYSVIFTSIRAVGDDEAYSQAASRMMEIAKEQDGFLGLDSVRDSRNDSQGVGMTVSYWRDLEAIRRWHENAEHKAVQARGRSHWYDHFSVRICRVEREYGFHREA